MRLVFCLLIGVLFSVTSSANLSLFVCEKNRISEYGMNSQDELGDILSFESRDRICSIDSREDTIFILAQKSFFVWKVRAQEVVEVLLPEQIQTAQDIVVLPNGDLAILDNQRDEVHFIDQAGTFQRTIRFLETPDQHRQNIKGIVVNDKLMISEDGNKRILQVDLKNYRVSVLRDFSGILRDSLGPIAFSNSTYYIAQGKKKILSFSEKDEKLGLIAELPEGNITGIVIFGETAYVSVNGITTKSPGSFGSIYKLDLSSGKNEKMIEKLYYPMDVILINH